VPTKSTEPTPTENENSLDKIVDIEKEKPIISFASDKKAYDPTKPHEIDGPAGKILVVRGNLNTQRMVGKAVAAALNGATVDTRTYETTWMSIMLQFITQSPGSLPAYAAGSIDKFLENIYEFDDLLHYYREWENWRNSFR